jgi:poly(hydroxyalkanoate) granule-associated protein
MVKKMQRSAEAEGHEKGTAGSAQFASTVKESASQIWLAGLAAFAKAQQEGTKAFDALVKEGVAIQRKTQAAAEEKISEATNRMASMATDISSKASGQWDKLESIFEERVSRAMQKMGVPSAADLEALSARIEVLERSGGAKPAASRRPSRAARPQAGVAAKPAAKKRPARKTAS